VMERRTAGECLEVTDRLGKMFSLLQTLPDSMKGSAKTPGKTWRAEEDRIVLVTNPKFYKIEGISMEKEQCKKRKKASRVVKTNNMLHMDLMRHAGYDDILTNKVLQLEKKKLQLARQRKSAKARNTRQPPKKNRVVEKEGDDESHEEGDDERGRKEDEDEE